MLPSVTANTGAPQGDITSVPWWRRPPDRAAPQVSAKPAGVTGRVNFENRPAEETLAAPGRGAATAETLGAPLAVASSWARRWALSLWLRRAASAALDRKSVV